MQKNNWISRAHSNAPNVHIVEGQLLRPADLRDFVETIREAVVQVAVSLDVGGRGRAHRGRLQGVQNDVGGQAGRAAGVVSGSIRENLKLARLDKAHGRRRRVGRIRRFV